MPAQAEFTPPPSFQRRLESRRAGQDVRRMAKATLAKITHTWSFPPSGNALNRPLDSSFRWNDNGNDGGAGVNNGWQASIQRFVRYMFARRVGAPATPSVIYGQAHMAARAHKSAALRHRHIIALFLARVELPRAADPEVRVFHHLQPLRDPAGRAGQGEHDGVHGGRDPQRL